MKSFYLSVLISPASLFNLWYNIADYYMKENIATKISS